MNKTGTIILAIVIVILVAIGIWYGVIKEQVSAPESKEPIKIGFIGPLSGDAAVAGQEEVNAINIALEELGNKINGKQIKIIVEDGKCDGKEAATVAQRLVSVDKVSIILGGLCSSETLGAAPITEANKVILFSAFSSSPNITNAGHFIFRTVLSDNSPDVIGPILPYLSHYKRIAIIGENSDYPVGVKQALKDNLSSTTEIVADEIFNSGEKDFRTYLTKIKAKNPEALFINVGTSANTPGLIVKQAKDLGISAALYGNYLLVGSESLKEAGNLLEGAIAYDAPLLDSSNLKAANFMEKYRATYGEPYSFWDAGARYDTVFIIVNALGQCGEDSECIRNYLYNMDWYNGTIGGYRFDLNGDVVGIKTVAKKVINGKVEVIK